MQMKQIDSQGRLQIPKALIELTEILPGGKVMMAFISIERYEIISENQITSDTKLCTGRINVDGKGRMVIPKDIRTIHEGKAVIMYVQNARLFIQFEKIE